VPHTRVSNNYQLLLNSNSSPAVSAILDHKRIMVTTWPFGVTWRYRSHDHSIPHGPFPIGGPLKRSLYLQSFSRYYALNIFGVMRLIFRVTRRTLSVTWPF